MIQLQGLTKRYGETVAVDDLTFEVRPGQVTGFLGPNGAGKSTTMRMVLGLDRPDAGQALINGRPYVELVEPLRQVGALLEARSIHPGRSAYNHLLFLAASNGISRRRVAEVLELVGLTAVARRRVGSFSLGMGQRLGIAAALLGDPPTLLFDEPVNGLDPEGIIWVRTLMRSLASEGRTVLVSSHLMAEMALTAEHIVVIGRGRLIADSSVAELVERTGTTEVRVRTPQPDELRAALQHTNATVRDEPDGTLTVSGLESLTIGQAAATNGITLAELTPLTASLEEAFLELTRDSVDFHGGGPEPLTAETARG